MDRLKAWKLMSEKSKAERRQKTGRGHPGSWSSGIWIRVLLLGLTLGTGMLSGFVPGIRRHVAASEALTDEELMLADYLLYCVSCAGEDGEVTLGLYQSVSDQVYGEDTGTGTVWGYLSQDYMVAAEDDLGEGLTRYRWEIAEGTDYNNEETGFYYTFEVPEGEYEVTVGFYNPFSARPITVTLEGETAVDAEKILKYKLAEFTETVLVTDGALDVKVYNPTRGSDAQKNPILSYILVRAVPEYGAEQLSAYAEQVSAVLEDPDIYTDDTFEAFAAAYKSAVALAQAQGSNADENSEESTEAITKALTENIAEADDDDKTADGYRQAYLTLKEAYENLEEITVYTSIINGQAWTDTEGNLIQAHGGQVQRLILTDPDTGETVEKWWWIGEDKSSGSSHGGICAYSSDDLYNWTFEGVVMRNVESREQLDEEDYFTELYAGYSDEQLDRVYECLDASTAIIERPKMIYNEKTGLYVLWFHADGPLTEGDSSYAAACAGVAVSETPYGPFRFIDRYRLNTCPEDQEDMYPESQGMARDMNLFVDEDGTAYIIYSSEENLTLYISKLNDEYTYLATDPEDAVYGVDFIRLYPGAQREAPVLFVRDGVYYLISSGCTGWAPNQARYYRADSIFGEWENCGDPCADDTNLTTFDSQSTCVFMLEDGTYVYMGDRWNSSDLENSRYIWLPLEFDEDGNLYLRYVDEWEQ